MQWRKQRQLGWANASRFVLANTNHIQTSKLVWHSRSACRLPQQQPFTPQFCRNFILPRSASMVCQNNRGMATLVLATFYWSEVASRRVIVLQPWWHTTGKLLGKMQLLVGNRSASSKLGLIHIGLNFGVVYASLWLPKICCHTHFVGYANAVSYMWAEVASVALFTCSCVHLASSRYTKVVLQAESDLIRVFPRMILNENDMSC